MIGNRLGVLADIPAELVAVERGSMPTSRWQVLAAAPEQLLELERWGASGERTRLSARERAIAALAVSRRSPYEIALLSRQASEAGLDSDEVRAVIDEDWTADCWSDAERILLRFALMFDAGHGIGDAIVEQLTTQYDAEQIIGLCHVCAYRGGLARLSIALRVEHLEESVS